MRYRQSSWSLKVPPSRTGAVGIVTAVHGYLPAGVVLVLGFLALTACVRQRDPRVPFIAILALIVLVIVATFGMIAGFAER